MVRLGGWYAAAAVYSIRILHARLPAASFIRVAHVARRVGKLHKLSSAVSISWHTANGPSTRIIGTLAKHTVPSFSANTFTCDVSSVASHCTHTRACVRSLRHCRAQRGVPPSAAPPSPARARAL